VITIREATREDVDLLHPLVAEMEDHYEGVGVVAPGPSGGA